MNATKKDLWRFSQLRKSIVGGPLDEKLGDKTSIKGLMWHFRIKFILCFLVSSVLMEMLGNQKVIN